MKTRQVKHEDAAEISAFLSALRDLGQRTLPSDEDFVLNNYIEHPDTIRCTVAVGEEGDLLGLQVLIKASVDNPYGVTPGWGIIGTHVNPKAHRRGVGKALFRDSLAAAKGAGLPHIDATIGAASPVALNYYEAMGFRTYRTMDRRICKKLDLTQ